MLGIGAYLPFVIARAMARRYGDFMPRRARNEPR